MAEKAKLEKSALSDPITLRVPQDILDDIEKIAETADRSRSWVIVWALKYYLMAEGNDVLQIRKGEEQIARGEHVDAEEFFTELLGEKRSDAAGLRQLRAALRLLAEYAEASSPYSI
ncbi:CopG family ribbon-helix-helix protein [Rhizobium wenxiniae]|uniref:CopG family ribbon-helix-helix protein n=1 Tax=Rhizobium wenxiniae TaxID=1737357 RepID=UPI003C15411A